MFASEGKRSGGGVPDRTGGGRGRAHVARTHHSTASGGDLRTVRHRRGRRRFKLLRKRPSRFDEGVHDGRRLGRFHFGVFEGGEGFPGVVGGGGRRVKLRLRSWRREGEGATTCSTAVSSGCDACELDVSISERIEKRRTYRDCP